MKPLGKAATLLPPAAFRADPLVALTAFARYIPHLLQVSTSPLWQAVPLTPLWNALCDTLKYA